jgi:hypothetical protein
VGVQWIGSCISQEPPSNLCVRRTEGVPGRTKSTSLPAHLSPQNTTRTRTRTGTPFVAASGLLVAVQLYCWLCVFCFMFCATKQARHKPNTYTSPFARTTNKSPPILIQRKIGLRKIVCADLPYMYSPPESLVPDIKGASMHPAFRRIDRVINHD